MASPRRVSRREALRLLTVAGTGSALGGSLLAGNSSAALSNTDGSASGDPPDPAAAGGPGTDASAPDASMRRREIPSSGEMLPVVGLGTWQQFDVGSSEEVRAPLKEVLRTMVDLGGSVIDSSPMYGRAERVVGELSEELGLTDEIFAATKVWTRGREDGIKQMKASMAKMRHRPMGLMQVHNLVDWQTHLKTLRRWKEEGRVRYMGVTHYRTDAFDELARAIRTTDIDFVQLPYSIQTRRAEERLLPLAAENGVAVIVNRPYEGGALFRTVDGEPLPEWAQSFVDGWDQFFLKFILSRPEVTCVIPGTSDPDHCRSNMRAGYGPMPDEKMRERMVQHFEQL
jgi:diketogulonate reductase-like aldo/keto reductase